MYPSIHASAGPDLFKAAAMRAVSKDLMAMKMDELKEELEVRDEATSGNKAWLRRAAGGSTRRSCASSWTARGRTREISMWFVLE